MVSSASLGGVILCRPDTKIRMTNTLRSKIDLCVQKSIPHIRLGLFPSMCRRPIERDQPKGEEKQEHQ